MALTAKLRLLAGSCLVALAVAGPIPIEAIAGSEAAKGTDAQGAFNSAKELGTADAWNAFLANYPTGFHADLARAYLKKLTDKAPAAAPAPAVAPSPAPPAFAQPTMPAGAAQELSCSERYRLRSQNSDVSTRITFHNISGNYRALQWIDFNGTLQDYGGLNSGEQKTIDTFVTHPWVIATGPGDCLQIFMPDVRPATVPLVRLAIDEPGSRPAVRASDRDGGASAVNRPAKPLVCGKNYKLRNGKCVLIQNCGANAYRNAEGDCHCNKNYEMRGGKCRWKQDKQGFEVAPWKKPGCKTWEKQCAQGNANACGQYEATCQVN